MRKIKRRPPNAAPLIALLIVCLIPMIGAYLYHFGLEAFAAAVAIGYLVVTLAQLFDR